MVLNEVKVIVKVIWMGKMIVNIIVMLLVKVIVAEMVMVVVMVVLLARIMLVILVIVKQTLTDFQAANLGQDIEDLQEVIRRILF